MTAVIQMRPDGSYTNKELERLVNDLRDFVQQQEIMHTKDAAAFLGISANKLYQMTAVPSHRVPGISGRIYLRTELIDYIKKY